MPITPYSTPIQFEYKPLGLEGFAKPLSEMQNQYDTTLNKVDELDFKIQSLSKDDAASKELIASLNEKRNQLRDSLMNTKNYKEAARKVLGLNREYSDDPRIQAIQQQAKAWQEADKEAKERYLKGELSQEDYQNWRNVTMGEYQGYDKSSINTMPLSKNEEDNIRKDVNSLLNATADQRKYTYGTLGIDEATGKKIEQVYEEHWKDKNQIAQEVSRLILTSDKYKEFYNSRADLNWRTFKLSGKEEDIARSTYQADLENNTYKAEEYKSRIDNLTKERDKVTDPAQKEQYTNAINSYQDALDRVKNRMDFVSNALANDQVDVNTARNLYSSQYLENKVNDLVSSNADLYDFNYLKQDKDYISPTKGGAGGGIGGIDNALNYGTITNDQYIEDITAQSLGATLHDVRKSMNTSFEEIDTENPSFTKVYGDKNRIAKTHILSNIGLAIANSSNYEEYSNKMKEYDPSFDPTNASNKNMYDKFSTDNGKINLNRHINKLSEESSKLQYTKSIYERAKEQVKKTSEYKQEFDKFANSDVLLPLDISRLLKPETQPAFGSIPEETLKANKEYNIKLKEGYKTVADLVNTGSNTSKDKVNELNKLVKLGVLTKEEANKQIQYTSLSKDATGYHISLKDLAKANGYDSVEKALEAGLLNNPAYKSVKNKYDNILNPKLNEELKNTPYASRFIITGTDKNAKELKSSVEGTLDEIVQDGAGIQKLKPMFNPQWQGTEGFDEEGGFTGKVIGNTQLGFTEQGLMMSIPISYKDGDTTKYKTIYAAFPNNQKLLEREMLTNMIKYSSSDSPKDKQDREMMYAALFNTYRPDNTLIPSYADSIEVTKENPATIYEFTDSDFKFKIVKNGYAKEGEKGKKNAYYQVKYKSPNSDTWEILTDENGKEIKTSNVNSMRTVLGERLYKPQ